MIIRQALQISQNNYFRDRLRFLSWLLLPLLIAACSSDAGQTQFETGLQSFETEVAGYNRSYLTYTPAGYSPDRPAPLLMVMHGGGGTAEAMVELTRFDVKAEEENFIAVFPQALPPDTSQPPRFGSNGPIWNDGSGRFHAGEQNIPDIPYINTVLNEVKERLNVNSDSVFMTGFSNGASMTFRSAVELSQTFNAIAPVAGTLWSDPSSISDPMPLLYISGALDTFNPAEGGIPRAANGQQFGDTPKPSILSYLQNWARAVNCSVMPDTTQFKPDVDKVTFSGCPNGTEINYIIVKDLGHVWPGKEPLLPESITGPSSDKINATNLIWKYFKSGILDNQN